MDFYLIEPTDQLVVPGMHAECIDSELYSPLDMEPPLKNSSGKALFR